MTTQRLIALSETKEHSDLTLGKQLILKMREQGVQTQDDILPLLDLPFLYADQIATFKQKFGNDKVQKVLDHVVKTERVRNSALKILRELECPCPISTVSLAITMCGVGECSELANRLAFDLMKAGCTRKINLIAMSKNGNMESNFSHVFVVVGDCSKLKEKNKLESFSQLADDCIFLDPKFKRFGLAKDIPSLMQEYIKVYGYNRIEQIVPFDPLQIKPTLGMIEENAKLISQMVTEQTGIKAVPQTKPVIEKPAVTKMEAKEAKNEAFPKQLDLNNPEHLMLAARMLLEVHQALEKQKKNTAEYAPSLPAPATSPSITRNPG